MANPEIEAFFKLSCYPSQNGGFRPAIGAKCSRLLVKACFEHADWGQHRPSPVKAEKRRRPPVAITKAEVRQVLNQWFMDIVSSFACVQIRL